MTQTSVPLETQVEHVAERLTMEYGDKVGPAVVRGLVDEAYSRYRAARVTQFVPVLVDRTVRQRLRSGV